MSTGGFSVTLNGQEIAVLAGIEAVLRSLTESDAISSVSSEYADFLRRIIERSHREYQER